MLKLGPASLEGSGKVLKKRSKSASKPWIAVRRSGERWQVIVLLKVVTLLQIYSACIIDHSLMH
jgi:hypothetical protein